MRKRRWVIVLLAGAAVFAAAHVLEVAGRIGGDAPWFISTLPSALFTTALIFAAGIAVGVTADGTAVDFCLSAIALVLGASVPLVITLFSHPGGPGTLFPLALMLGVALLAFGSFAGTAIGWLLRFLR